MLAAYLRGLLKPSTPFGLRSLLFEEVIFEGMSSYITAENFRVSIVADSAIAGILNEDSKRNLLRRISRQTKRQAALQLMDIYDLANGYKAKAEDGGGRISLLQLFYLMKKEGIIVPDAAPSQNPET